MHKVYLSHLSEIMDVLRRSWVKDEFVLNSAGDVSFLCLLSFTVM